MTEIFRHEPNRRLSTAVIHDSVVYLAGQLDDTAETAYQQTVNTLEKINNILKECGSDKSRVLHATVHLASMEDYGAMNTAWDEWITPHHTPARVAVQAPLAREAARVEISITAAQLPE